MSTNSPLHTGPRAAPFVILVMTPFIEQIDPNLESAARMLGAGRLAIFLRVHVLEHEDTRHRRPPARHSNARSPHFLILLNSLPGPVG